MRAMAVALPFTSALYYGGRMHAHDGANSLSRSSEVQHVDLRETPLLHKRSCQRSLKAAELVCSSSIQYKFGSIGFHEKLGRNMVKQKCPVGLTMEQ